LSNIPPTRTVGAVPCIGQGKHTTDSFWFLVYSPITFHMSYLLPYNYKS